MTAIGYNELLHISLFICCITIMVTSLAWWRHLYLSDDIFSIFFKTRTIRTLTYITYGPLNGLSLLLSLLEVKLVIKPAFKQWKNLNQRIVILPHVVRDQSVAPLDIATRIGGFQISAGQSDRRIHPSFYQILRDISNGQSNFSLELTKAADVSCSKSENSLNQLRSTTQTTALKGWSKSRGLRSCSSELLLGSKDVLVVSEMETRQNLDDSEPASSQGKWQQQKKITKELEQIFLHFAV